MTPRLRTHALLCALIPTSFAISPAQEPVPEKLIVPTPARSFYGTTINDTGGVFTLDPVTNDLMYHDGIVSTSTVNIIRNNFTPVGSSGLLNGYFQGIPLRATLLGETCQAHSRVFFSTNTPYLLTYRTDGAIIATADLTAAPLTPNPDPSNGAFFEVNTGVSSTRSERGSVAGLVLIAIAFITESEAAEVFRVVNGDDDPPPSYNSEGTVASEPVPGTPGGTGGESRSSYVATVSPDSNTRLEFRGASTDTTGPFVSDVYVTYADFTTTNPPTTTFEGPAIAGDRDMTLFNLGSGSSTSRQVGDFLELYPLNPGVNIVLARDRAGTPRQMLLLCSDAFDLREGPPGSGCSGPANGDYNNSGGIDNADYLQWCSMVPVSALNKPITVGNAAADLNGNGLTDLYDLSQMMRCQANALGPRGGSTADPNFRNPSVGFIVTSEFAAVPDVPGFNVDFFIACRGNGRGVGSVLVQCDPAGAGTPKTVALTFDQNGFSNVLEKGQDLGDGIINVFVDNAQSLDRGASEVNRNGQMAFTVAFNGGNNGIYRVTGVPVPEPVARVEADHWMLLD